MGNNSTANSEAINGLLGRIETALEGPAEMEALLSNFRAASVSRFVCHYFPIGGIPEGEQSVVTLKFEGEKQTKQ